MPKSFTNNPDTVRSIAPVKIPFAFSDTRNHPSAEGLTPNGSVIANLFEAVLDLFDIQGSIFAVFV